MVQDWTQKMPLFSFSKHDTSLLTCNQQFSHSCIQDAGNHNSAACKITHHQATRTRDLSPLDPKLCKCLSWKMKSVFWRRRRNIVYYVVCVCNVHKPFRRRRRGFCVCEWRSSFSVSWTPTITAAWWTTTAAETSQGNSNTKPFHNC